MKTKSRMYEVNGKRVRTWNPFAGCNYNCSYCYGPEIYKRFSKCEQCKNFTPHFHKGRLKQKFKPGETVFVCSMGDISFASFDQFAEILRVINEYPETTFYIQSKNPLFFSGYLKRCSIFSYFYQGGRIGNNVVLGTTIETNYPNHYLIRGVSKAPSPLDRMVATVKLDHQRKYVSIEPEIAFSVSGMTDWIKQIEPEFVYIGYDNHRNLETLDIPEPSLEDTEELINELKKFTEVRLKSIRRGWDENE